MKIQHIRMFGIQPKWCLEIKRRKCIVLNVYIRKEESLEIKDLSVHLKRLEKEET